MPVSSARSSEKSSSSAKRAFRYPATAVRRHAALTRSSQRLPTSATCALPSAIPHLCRAAHFLLAAAEQSWSGDISSKTSPLFSPSGVLLQRLEHGGGAVNKSSFPRESVKTRQPSPESRPAARPSSPGAGRHRRGTALPSGAAPAVGSAREGRKSQPTLQNCCFEGKAAQSTAAPCPPAGPPRQARPERRRQSPAAAHGGRTAPSGDAEEPRPGPVTTADGTRRAPGPARIGGRGRARGPAPHRAPSAPAAPQEGARYPGARPARRARPLPTHRHHLRRRPPAEAPPCRAAPGLSRCRLSARRTPLTLAAVTGAPARLAPRSGRKEEAKAAAGLAAPSSFSFLLLSAATAAASCPPASFPRRFLLCSAPPAPRRPARG